MYTYRVQRDEAGRIRVQVPLTGAALLEEPMYNKGTAFTLEERHRFGIEGLLPRHVSTIEQQMARVYENLGRKESDLERYVALAALHDRNEHLFYRLLIEHVRVYARFHASGTKPQYSSSAPELIRPSASLEPSIGESIFIHSPPPSKLP